MFKQNYEFWLEAKIGSKIGSSVNKFSKKISEFFFRWCPVNGVLIWFFSSLLVAGRDSQLACGEVKHGDENIGRMVTPGFPFYGIKDAVESPKKGIGVFPIPIGEDALLVTLTLHFKLPSIPRNSQISWMAWGFC